MKPYGYLFKMIWCG